jgi:4-hydroxyphenylacetate 3-monooxygenase
VLAPVLWPFEAMRSRWDSCVLRSWVDGRLYQEVGVDKFLHPDDLLRVLRERVPGAPARDVMLFGGTIVSLDKALGFGRVWEIELSDPGAGRAIRHRYEIVQLFAAVAERYRVPLVAADRSIS